MRILRGIQPIANVTAVFVLVLATASSLVIVSPQPTSAEGFLLGTVRCLVRSVLTGECQKVAPSAQQPAPAPAQPSTPSEPAPQSSPQPEKDQTSLNAPVKQPNFVPIETPEPQQVMPVPVAGTAVAGSSRIPESEYVAYFNAHSPYAAQDVQGASVIAPIERSSEGWRLFGVAWYVWVGFIVLAMGGFATVRHGFLRRKSVLSKGG